MVFLTRFRRDERGSLAGRFANIAAVVAVGAVALASLLDRVTRDGGASAIAFLLPADPAAGARHDPISRTARAGPQFGPVDTTPTGSINPAIVLDPCTGKQK